MQGWARETPTCYIHTAGVLAPEPCQLIGEWTSWATVACFLVHWWPWRRPVELVGLLLHLHVYTAHLAVAKAMGQCIMPVKEYEVTRKLGGWTIGGGSGGQMRVQVKGLVDGQERVQLAGWARWGCEVVRDSWQVDSGNIHWNPEWVCKLRDDIKHDWEGWVWFYWELLRLPSLACVSSQGVWHK